MEDMDKTVYRLYALPVNSKTVEEAQAHRFSRITPLYLLIYSVATISAESVEITEADLDRLSSADRDWLLGCNLTIIAEDAKTREKEISETLGEKIERLEEALKAAASE